MSNQPMETVPYKYNLFRDVHLHLPNPTEHGRSFLVKGPYTYFHYGCDGYNDVGWGCGYRTLQSMCSWILNAKREESVVPSLVTIQSTLVDISDKPANFLGSREWIGALEVFYVIDTLYDVPCRIQHIPKNEDVKKYASVIKRYFEEFGGLVMMGGDLDASSKAIAGIHIADNDAYLLVVDPHMADTPTTIEELIKLGFVKWQHVSSFVDSSFYNLCLPQLKGSELQ